MNAPMTDSPDQSPIRSRLGQRLFLGFLFTVGGLYAVLMVYHAYVISQPQEVPFAEKMGLLEECRQVCMRYGLLTTGHIKNDANAYLAKVGAKRLPEDLALILADKGSQPVATQPDPLLGKPAPDFELLDVNGQLQTLSNIRGGGPAIVVFYYGYGCSHCVAQLFGLQKDLKQFEELGVPIVAISPDTPDHTAEKYKEYGPFTFPVLSDPDNKAAFAYGTYVAASENKPEKLVHGTFLISPEGTIEWANTGNEPFVDNKSLLLRMAEITGAWSP